MADLQCPWCVSMSWTEERIWGEATWAGDRPTISGSLDYASVAAWVCSNIIKSCALQEPYTRETMQGLNKEEKKSFLQDTSKRAHLKQENPSSSSVLPGLLLTRLNIMLGSKGEIFIRPSTTITEQATRSNLKWKGKKINHQHNDCAFSFLDFWFFFW